MPTLHSWGQRTHLTGWKLGKYNLAGRVVIRETEWSLFNLTSKILHQYSNFTLDPQYLFPIRVVTWGCPVSHAHSLCVCYHMLFPTQTDFSSNPSSRFQISGQTHLLWDGSPLLNWPMVAHPDLPFFLLSVYMDVKWVHLKCLLWSSDIRCLFRSTLRLW